MSSLFISYCHRDRQFAERLWRDLDSFGLQVWIDSGQLRLGDSLIDTISAALRQADYVGVVLSPDSVASKWVQLELRTALSLELEIGEVKVLPLLSRNCDIPPFLLDKVHADFRGEGGYAAGLRPLLERLLNVSLAGRPASDLARPDPHAPASEARSREETIASLSGSVGPIVLKVFQGLPPGQRAGLQIQDLVQTGLLAVVRAINEYDPRWPIDLETFCRQRVAQAARREVDAWINASALYAAERWDIERVGPAVRPVLAVDQHLERMAADDWIADVLKNLNRTEQLLMKMYYIEEMTMKEIGATLNLSESRVSQMHSSIVVRLQAQLRSRAYQIELGKL